jgi:hypothetical protein
MSVYTPTPEAQARVANNFRYHEPTGGEQVATYEAVRLLYRSLADKLLLTCPESRELSLALTNLEQSQFWANASIARNENPSPEGNS